MIQKINNPPTMKANRSNGRFSRSSKCAIKSFHIVYKIYRPSCDFSGNHAKYNTIITPNDLFPFWKQLPKQEKPPMKTPNCLLAIIEAPFTRFQLYLQQKSQRGSDRAADFRIFANNQENPELKECRGGNGSLANTLYSICECQQTHE